MRGNTTVYACDCGTWQVEWTYEDLSTYPIYVIGPLGDIQVNSKAVSDITDEVFFEHANECAAMADKIALVFARRLG